MLLVTASGYMEMSVAPGVMAVVLAATGKMSTELAAMVMTEALGSTSMEAESTRSGGNGCGITSQSIGGNQQKRWRQAL